MPADQNNATAGFDGMFKTAKIIDSLHSDWDYPVTSDERRDLQFLLQRHSQMKRLPPTAAAGLFLCHLMKRDYEFTSLNFPDLLIKILNLPTQDPERLNHRDAQLLLEAATGALVRHQHPYLDTFADHLPKPAA
jgi:hypothetical protein